MNLTEPILLTFIMCAITAVACVLFKGKWGKVAPTMFVTSLVMMLVAGQGFQLRVATEGPFVYLDNIMWVLTGAGFVFALYLNGTFDYLFNKIIAAKRGDFVQMLLLVLFIGLPGMITGSALACVATTGLMVGKYLLDKGVEKAKVVELVAVGSLLGMNDKAAAGMVATLANNIPMFGMLHEMDERGKIINVAFAVSAAFVFGDHLGFTAGFDSTMILPMIVGKLVGGVTAVAVAMFITRKEARHG